MHGMCIVSFYVFLTMIQNTRSKDVSLGWIHVLSGCCDMIKFILLSLSDKFDSDRGMCFMCMTSVLEFLCESSHRKSAFAPDYFEISLLF